METLPIELVQHICLYLDRNDVKVLSQVSTSLSGKTQSIRFETVDVILWKSGWTNFVNFLNNGQYLHHHVRRLRYHVQSPEKEMETTRTMMGWICWLYQFYPAPTEGDVLGSTKFREALGLDVQQTYRACMKEHKERKTVIAFAFNGERLCKIFQKLHNVKAVELVADGLGNEKKEGRQCIEQIFGTSDITSYWDGRLNGRWATDKPIHHSRFLDGEVLNPFITAATSITSNQINELDIGTISWQYLYDLERDSASSVSDWKRLLGNVTKLSLSFSSAVARPMLPMYNPDGGFEKAYIKHGIPQTIVNCASSALRDLRLGWQSLTDPADADPWQPCNLILQRHFPHLRILALLGFEANMKSFINFLQRHGDTLEQLEFCNMLFDPEIEEYDPRENLADLVKQQILELLSWITRNLNLRHAYPGRDIFLRLGQHMNRMAMDEPCRPPFFNQHRGLVSGPTGTGHFKPFDLQVGLAIAVAQPWDEISLPRRQFGRFTREDRVEWLNRKFVGHFGY